MRVLVVEDEARLAKQLSGALAHAGYAVDCAGDGERADFLTHTERYDAVLLDLGLPKVDGLTLLRRWRDSGPRCSCSPRAAAGTRRCRGLTAAPTTTSPSLSGWRKCSRVCAR